MLISGTNISTFKMKLLKLGDYYNLPALKKIFSELNVQAVPAMTASESKTCTLTICGSYTSADDLLENLNAFETLIKSNVKHPIVIAGHNLTFNAVFASGVNVSTFRRGQIAKITITLTIAQ